MANAVTDFDFSNQPSAKCTFCGKWIRFPNQKGASKLRYLLYHVRWHLDLFPYKCPKCNFSGRASNRIREHIMKMHHGIGNIIDNTEDPQYKEEVFQKGRLYFPELASTWDEFELNHLRGVESRRQRKATFYNKYSKNINYLLPDKEHSQSPILPEVDESDAISEDMEPIDVKSIISMLAPPMEQEINEEPGTSNSQSTGKNIPPLQVNHFNDEPLFDFSEKPPILEYYDAHEMPSDDSQQADNEVMMSEVKRLRAENERLLAENEQMSNLYGKSQVKKAFYKTEALALRREVELLRQRLLADQ